MIHLLLGFAPFGERPGLPFSERGELSNHRSVLAIMLAIAVTAKEPVNIGSRWELFIDDYLVERLNGKARLVVRKPTPQEVVLVTKKPWEGNSCCYFTVLQDGDIYRMYYRGSKLNLRPGGYRIPHNG